MAERIKTWSKLTADCLDKAKAPEGPARLFVYADLNLVFCEIQEARVTSYSDKARPYADGTRAHIDLTPDELDWLIESLQSAQAVLKEEAIAQGTVGDRIDTILESNDTLCMDSAADREVLARALRVGMSDGLKDV